MVAYDDLRRIYLLEDLTDDMLGRMLPFTQLRIFGEESVVYNEGDPAEAFFMLKKGKLLLEVAVSTSVNISLGSIKPGYAFGWSALFSGGAYASSAVCVEPCEVLSIPGKEMVDILDGNHTIGYRVMEGIVRILKRRLERRTEQFLTTLRTHPDIENLLAQEKE
ncbi:MAG: Crp/Fnr family transcriptional regulator [Deltaproteobacteria bacterium]|nr:Crp/Fnr family transcriptional regulator [Deltaproteobacteria bacterium]